VFKNQRYMITRTALFTLLLFVQLSCSNDEVNIGSFNDDPTITTLNGTWKVISFEDFATNTTETKTQENSWGKDIIVSFNDDLNPKLISGQVTTNSVVGEFEYVGQRQFKVNRYGTTFVGQPVWADKFGEALSDTVTFGVNKEQLRIYFDNKTKSVTLTKE
jgi:hypothetical protein